MHHFPVREALPADRCGVEKMVGDGKLITDEFHIQSHNLFNWPSMAHKLSKSSEQWWWHAAKFTNIPAKCDSHSTQFCTWQEPGSPEERCIPFSGSTEWAHLCKKSRSSRTDSVHAVGGKMCTLFMSPGIRPKHANGGYESGNLSDLGICALS